MSAKIMMYWTYGVRIFILAALVLVIPGRTAMASEEACKNLIGAGAPNVQILKAQHVSPGPAQKDPMAAMTGAALTEVDLPGYCLVQGVIEQRMGSDGKP